MNAASASSFDMEASVKAGGFKAKTSGGSTSTSDDSKSTSAMKAQMSSVKIGGKRQFGMIDASGSGCGELLGDKNLLFPIQYEQKAYWEIEKLPEGFRSTLKTYVKNFYQSA